MTTAFDAWVGREEERSERVLGPSVSAMAATLDMDSAPTVGQPLPPGWQWMFFNPVVRRSGLGSGLALISLDHLGRRAARAPSSGVRRQIAVLRAPANAAQAQ